MRVVLAGYNVESEILAAARERFGEAVTPEVLSAAYARISRDPRGVSALRKEALHAVEKARRSNERIVFGLGHASVAEHAVMNFDVTGISRLAVEEIEHFRLASFTEKSQRYICLGKDIVVPPEISSAKGRSEFRLLVSSLHGAYEDAFKAIAAAGAEEGAAKEDARYLMPLATSTQFGMTVNARELEYMIERLAAHPLQELRSFSRRIHAAAHRIVPSLIRYPKPSEHLEDMAGVAAEIAAIASRRRRPRRLKHGDVSLIDATPDADARLAAAILFSSRGGRMEEARAAVLRLSPSKRQAIIEMTMRRLGAHDTVWREFETVHFLFELIVSASCYAQLKRHRIATIIPQPYDCSLGLAVPGTFVRSKAVGILRAGAGRAERYYRRHRGELAAEYALLNAHRRRVLLACNLRELYHFSRLRSDMSAQWEIRMLSDGMCRLAREKAPIGARLLGGKDGFQGTT